jgi:hypothetical protein
LARHVERGLRRFQTREASSYSWLVIDLLFNKSCMLETSLAPIS